MRKLIAAMNMTLDGFCDHTAMIADDEIHQHYNELLSNAGTLIYGRITYQLMESYWPSVVKNPIGNKPTGEFAVLIDNISKIVFSRTLKRRRRNSFLRYASRVFWNCSCHALNHCALGSVLFVARGVEYRTFSSNPKAWCFRSASLLGLSVDPDGYRDRTLPTDLACFQRFWGSRNRNVSKINN